MSEPAVQSRNVRSSSTPSENTELRSSRVHHEKATLLNANEVRPIVRAIWPES